MSNTALRPKLKPDALYIGENGRIHCGKVHCAGLTAHLTGRNLHGGRALLVSPRVAAQLVAEGVRPTCGTCGLTLDPEQRP